MVDSTRTASDQWWRDAVIYQIYPRSFADASGDGVGAGAPQVWPENTGSPCGPMQR